MPRISDVTHESNLLSSAVGGLGSQERPRYSYINRLDEKGSLPCVLYNIGTMEGHRFIRYATSQEGSRLLQEILSCMNERVTQIIFNRVVLTSSRGMSTMYNLMIDGCGSHVLLKLVECCSLRCLTLIMLEMTSDEEAFFQLILNKNGAQSMRRLIKLMKHSPLISNVIIILTLKFYEIMINPVGSSVICESLDHLTAEQSGVLYEAAIRDCVGLAIHKHGCYSLYKFLDSIQGPQRYRLLDKISGNSLLLSQNPSGNYLVQRVLQLRNPAFTNKICTLLSGHYVLLSFQKGGSHVVERCLDTWKMNLVAEELGENSKHLLHMATDQYGNYVIQKALQVTEKAGSPVYGKLVKGLLPHLYLLRLGFGRNIYSMLR